MALAARVTHLADAGLGGLPHHRDGGGLDVLEIGSDEELDAAGGLGGGRAAARKRRASGGLGCRTVPSRSNLREIKQAAQMANAHEFIEALDAGYDTQVGERGSRLSGGQRQRISIARAFLKNAPIIILDEPTSALDAESEHQIQAALENLSKGRTVLIIAHRFSTIQHADRILVFDAGKIVATGSHSELYPSSDLYRSLYDKQARTVHTE